MIRAKCECLDDRYKGYNVWHYVIFLPKESAGAGISVHFRKSIGVPFGGDDVVDASDWEGKRFMAYVVQETYEGQTRNKFKKISPMRDSTVEQSVSEEESVPF